MAYACIYHGLGEAVVAVITAEIALADLPPLVKQKCLTAVTEATEAYPAPTLVSVNVMASDKDMSINIRTLVLVG